MLAFVIFFHTTLLRMLSGGPNDLVPMGIENCRASWWRTLLYYSNFDLDVTVSPTAKVTLAESPLPIMNKSPTTWLVVSVNDKLSIQDGRKKTPNLPAGNTVQLFVCLLLDPAALGSIPSIPFFQQKNVNAARVIQTTMLRGKWTVA